MNIREPTELFVKSTWVEGRVRGIWADFTKAPTLVGWISGTVILGIVGPFGMAETTGLPRRLLYWLIVIAVALLIAFAIKVLAFHLLGTERRALTVIVSMFAFSALFTPFLISFNHLFYPERVDGLLPGPQLFLFIAIVFGAIGALVSVVEAQIEQKLTEQFPATSGTEMPYAMLTTQNAPEPGDGMPEEFGKRLQPHLRQAGLIRLSMQDHYVEVHTDMGAQLVLMRMSDAVKELSTMNGFQVHRSHWVARDAVTGSRREKGRLYLTTIDGGDVPVSRSFRESVKEAGLI